MLMANNNKHFPVPTTHDPTHTVTEDEHLSQVEKTKSQVQILPVWLLKPGGHGGKKKS